MGQDAWNRLIGRSLNELDPETVPVQLEKVAGLTHPEWLPDLARLELSCHRAMNTPLPQPEELQALTINPSLQLLPVPWTHLLTLLTFAKKQDMERVEPGEELVLIWSDPANKNLRFESALPDHLLALKMVAEGISPEEAAQQANQPIALFDAVLWDAVRKGVLLAPLSSLRRTPAIASQAVDHRFVAAEVFTLQWHLTQSCDLSCKHCYDRSQRAAFPFYRAVTLMQELRDFCWSRFVRPQVSFSGGNPLLHPDFYRIYQAAADHGLMTAILGNATERSNIERLMAIQRPVYYQVSLEGLEEHNDTIRGEGNFRRTIAFLEMLTELGVPNMVMLTLTRNNLDQVIPLAEQLEGITGGLTFNRLALFGEGARLALPTREEYRAFLEQYVAAMPTHPVLALKDSLLNSIYDDQGKPLFGGCAGFGCGAAFNFVAILSDGEVHACRKFPSPIGNILNQNLEEVYNSETAARYRDGSTACNGCTLRAVCGGCLAVTASFGHDPLTSKDPYCFRTK
ncbi:thio(seleno)oxazole modification radical SAM maturase SbtM [Trichlorobacter lovleyi]|uniref:thio(seleno)oxazole modification radical SAM maturase SbtM n=1 Tax=Trichlorobacter lovleyi TaxID=313985 RepID=UPI00223ECEFD|nr:thio(seleno)oxazole modification radical SAM maturase SbtM [Trichlorobacter lovleyi]